MIPLIDDEHKIIFFWTPKCACSTIKNYYASISSELKNKKIDNIHAAVKITPVTDINKYNNYKKILFVRDPYERIVSAFISAYGYFGLVQYNLDDINFATWFWNNFLASTGNIDILYDKIIIYKRNPSFRNFIKILESVDIKNIDGHFRPQTQTHSCPQLNKANFNEIVNIKYLNNTLEKLNKELNVNGTIKYHNTLQYNHDNVYMCDVDIVTYSKKNNKTYPKWIYFYDNELKNSVFKIYEKDFKLIGYQDFKLLF